MLENKEILNLTAFLSQIRSKCKEILLKKKELKYLKGTNIDTNDPDNILSDYCIKTIPLNKTEKKNKDSSLSISKMKLKNDEISVDDIDIKSLDSLGINNYEEKSNSNNLSIDNDMNEKLNSIPLSKKQQEEPSLPNHPGKKFIEDCFLSHKRKKLYSECKQKQREYLLDYLNNNENKDNRFYKIYKNMNNDNSNNSQNALNSLLLKEKLENDKASNPKDLKENTDFNRTLNDNESINNENETISSPHFKVLKPNETKNKITNTKTNIESSSMSALSTMSILVKKLNSESSSVFKLQELCESLNIENLKYLFARLNSNISNVPQKQIQKFDECSNKYGLSARMLMIELSPFIKKHIIKKLICKNIVLKALSAKLLINEKYDKESKENNPNYVDKTDISNNTKNNNNINNNYKSFKQSMPGKNFDNKYRNIYNSFNSNNSINNNTINSLYSVNNIHNNNTNNIITSNNFNNLNEYSLFHALINSKMSLFNDNTQNSIPSSQVASVNIRNYLLQTLENLTLRNINNLNSLINKSSNNSTTTQSNIVNINKDMIISENEKEIKKILDIINANNITNGDCCANQNISKCFSAFNPADNKKTENELYLNSLNINDINNNNNCLLNSDISELNKIINNNRYNNNDNDLGYKKIQNDINSYNDDLNINSSNLSLSGSTSNISFKNIDNNYTNNINTIKKSNKNIEVSNNKNKTCSYISYTKLEKILGNNMLVNYKELQGPNISSNTSMLSNNDANQIFNNNNKSDIADVNVVNNRNRNISPLNNMQIQTFLNILPSSLRNASFIRSLLELEKKDPENRTIKILLNTMTQNSN